MSNKNLLNEGQIRQFMKLAKLEPLTPGFVEGLTEATTTEDELEEAHGRGGNEYNDAAGAHRGGGVKLDETEADPDALEDYAAGDLERGHPEEAEADELEADAEMGDDLEVEDDAPSEEELLAALEVIARAAGLEGLDMDVSGDVDDVEDVEDIEVFDEPEVADVEVEDELEVELQEGEPKSEKKWGGDAGDDRRRWNPKTKTKQRVKDFGESTEASDDLVEQITKRVAARILKSALAKK